MTFAIASISKPKLHLWIPNMFEFKGGIQVYSAFLLQAVQQIPQIDQCEVFLKHDCQPDSESFQEISFHCAGKWHPRLRSLVYAAQLFKYGIIQRPDLIISTHVNFTLVAYWLKRFANIPYWAVAHGVDAWNIQKPMLQTALLHADRILAVSHYTRDRLLREQPLDPEKVVVLPNTFDAQRFQASSKPTALLQQYGLKPDQPVILTVCRLAADEQYKGYDRILEAMPRIRQTIPNVHYLIVGKGNDQHRVQQMIVDLQLENCVTLAGFVPDEELCDHYNLCDIFAMPSKGEGFGIVYLEAMACGKPVVGGNQDGAIDALCQGQLGALVNPDDVEEIAQTLIRILQGTDSNRLIYHPAQLRQKVIDIYGFNRFQHTLADLLRA
jgi:glycosyltransferase involved in cell wall biosynthesis